MRHRKEVMIKKILYISATLLEVLGLLGAYMVQYFTRRRMGMARYVVYKNQGWEAKYPMELLARGAALAAAVLAVSLAVFFFKGYRKSGKMLWFMNAASILLTAVYVGFTWMKSADGFRAYYFISGILAAVSLIQMIKTFAGMLVCGHET